MLMLLDPGLCAALRGLGSAISILVMLMAAWAIGLRHADVALLTALRNGRTYL